MLRSVVASVSLRAVGRVAIGQGVAALRAARLGAPVPTPAVVTVIAIACVLDPIERVPLVLPSFCASLRGIDDELLVSRCLHRYVFEGFRFLPFQPC